MPAACSAQGTSPKSAMAPIRVQKGPVARMGAALVIGNVRKARYVAVQLAPTIALLAKSSGTCLTETSATVPNPPVAKRNAESTAHPLNVVANSVGKTELPLTLAFLHRSYMLKATLEARIQKSQESAFIVMSVRNGKHPFFNPQQAHGVGVEYLAEIGGIGAEIAHPTGQP